MHRVGNALGVLRAEEMGQGHVGADGQSDQQIHDQIHQGAGGPHLGQGVAARKAADDHQIRRVEQQLQQAGEHHRQGKEQQLRQDGADGHIDLMGFFHGKGIASIS